MTFKLIGQKFYNYHWFIGLLIILIFWFLNWHLPGLRTHWGFFPLWFGYILLVDGWVYKRRKSSILSKSAIQFLLMFVASIPLWWLFEGLNERTHYWVYSSNDKFTDLEYTFFATISFSTVVPAILETADLVLSFFKSPEKKWIHYGNKNWHCTLFFILGWIMLFIVLFSPQYGMAFIWMSLFFILDPINLWLGNPSILAQTAKGNWRMVWALWIASLVCGLFWEMWNYLSWPKWYYTIPGVDFWYIFEMPFLGYLGYLPFSLEIYAFYSLFLSILRIRDYPTLYRV